MGHRRKLLREAFPGKYGRKRERKGQAFRDTTGEFQGTRTMLERLGVPERFLPNKFAPDEMRTVYYHFTKGWRQSRPKKA